jgi:hypothetical protein
MCSNARATTKQVRHGNQALASWRSCPIDSQAVVIGNGHLVVAGLEAQVRDPVAAVSNPSDLSRESRSD